MATTTTIEMAKFQAKRIGIKDAAVVAFISRQLGLANIAAQKDALTASVQWEAFLRACKRRDHFAALGTIIALKRTAGVKE